MCAVTYLHNILYVVSKQVLYFTNGCNFLPLSAKEIEMQLRHCPDVQIGFQTTLLSTRHTAHTSKNLQKVTKEATREHSFKNTPALSKISTLNECIGSLVL